MGFIKNLRLRARYAARLGAFSAALKKGLTVEQARIAANLRYPPNADDEDYEQAVRQKALRRAAKKALQRGLSPEEAIEEALREIHGSNYTPPRGE